jgi:hypothetical protein
MPQRFARLGLPLTPSLRRALVLSQVLAVVWWAVAFYFYYRGQIPVWFDQTTPFTRVGAALGDPYELTRFANPPWTALALIPFTGMAVPAAALIQIALLFGMLTLVIHKFGGNWRTVLLTLTAYWALDNALQINIEWLVCLGLLLPPAWGAPFVLMKPQVVAGVWLSFSRRDLIRVGIVSAALIGPSIVVWGNWPQRLYANAQSAILGQSFNIAPLALLPWPLVILPGIALAWIAWQRRDPILSVLASLFFVPYIAFYSLIVHFALLAIRLPRWALLISVVVWIAYGRIVLAALSG